MRRLRRPGGRRASPRACAGAASGPGRIRRRCRRAARRGQSANARRQCGCLSRAAVASLALGPGGRLALARDDLERHVEPRSLVAGEPDRPGAAASREGAAGGSGQGRAVFGRGAQEWSTRGLPVGRGRRNPFRAGLWRYSASDSARIRHERARQRHRVRLFRRGRARDDGGRRAPRRRGGRPPVRPPAGVTPLLRLVGLIGFAILVVVLLVFAVRAAGDPEARGRYETTCENVDEAGKQSEQIGRKLNTLLTIRGQRLGRHPRAGSGSRSSRSRASTRRRASRRPARCATSTGRDRGLHCGVSGSAGSTGRFAQTAPIKNASTAGGRWPHRRAGCSPATSSGTTSSRSPARSSWPSRAYGASRCRTRTSSANPDLATRQLDGVHLAAHARSVDRRWHRLQSARHGTRVGEGAPGRKRALPVDAEHRRGVREPRVRRHDRGHGLLAGGRIPITLTIQKSPEPIVKKQTVRSSIPARRQTVDFSQIGQVPFATRTSVKVEVEPVKSETRTSNNTAEYPVIFSPRAKPSRAGHRPLDRLELLGRERHGGAAAIELLDVDARVVAALDRADDDARARRVEEGQRRATDGRRRPRRRRSGRSRSSRRSASTRRSTRERPVATSSTARCRSSIRPWSETAKSTRSPSCCPQQNRLTRARRRACASRDAKSTSAAAAAQAAAIAIRRRSQSDPRATAPGATSEGREDTLRSRGGHRSSSRSRARLTGYISEGHGAGSRPERELRAAECVHGAARPRARVQGQGRGDRAARRSRLRAATASFPWPHVIRLLNYVRVPRAIQRKISRRALFARDGWRCVYCGHSGGRLTLDHVVPRARGRVRLGERRHGVRALQPAQGRPLLEESGLALSARAEAAGAGAVHPPGRAADPARLAAVPRAAARPRPRRKSSAAQPRSSGRSATPSRSTSRRRASRPSALPAPARAGGRRQ